MKRKTRQKEQLAKTAPTPPVYPPSAKQKLLRGQLAIFLALLALLATVPYLNTLSNEFVLDDIGIIVQNPLIRDLANVGKIFTTNYWNTGQIKTKWIDPGLYRPFTVFTYAIDYRLGKLNPEGYHVVNLALHAITTLLFFVVALEILESPMAVFAAAAIFAVHPIHTEAVTGIVGRAEVLAMLFFLLAFWFSRLRTISGSNSDSRTSKVRTRICLGAAALFYLLGMFSKETAVTLVGILLVDDWMHREEFLRTPATRRAVNGPTLGLVVSRYIVFGIVIVIYVAFRNHAVTGRSNIWAGFAGVFTDQRIFTASRVLMEYLGLLVFPHTLSAEYWKPEVPIAYSPFEPLVLLSLVLWVALGYVVLRSIRNARPLFFSLAWFFITVLPVSNLLFAIGVGKAERILYLPSAGFCLFVGWLYGWLEKKTNKQWLLVLPLAPILVVFAVRTYDRNADWKNYLTLALATLKVAPTSQLFNNAAGLEYRRLGELDKAIPFLEESVRQRPGYAPYHTNLADAYDDKNRIDEAVKEYLIAIQLDPTFAEAHVNLGSLYFRKGQADQAIEEFKEAIRLEPKNSDAHSNLGGLYLNKNNFDEAVKELTVAIELNPNNAEAHNNLGTAYLSKGRIDEAIKQYNDALRLKPDYADARNNLALAQQRKPLTQRSQR